MDSFPAFIPLSADSLDILAYIDQPLPARKPVGCQHDFLGHIIPANLLPVRITAPSVCTTWGKTTNIDEPAGTYRSSDPEPFVDRLIMGIGHLEGNTYSRPEPVNLSSTARPRRGKGAIETQMILNHKTAIELLVETSTVPNLTATP